MSRLKALAPTLLVGATLLVLWGLQGGFVVGLLRHGDGYEPLVDGWLGNLTTSLPALVVLAASRRTDPDVARELRLLGGGALVWSLGGWYVAIVSATSDTLPFPAPSDALFLCFPPMVFAAVLLRVRRELAGQQRTVWLDAALGGLGASAGLAVVAGPLISAATGEPLTVLVAAGYPFTDLVLVATVVGVVAAYGLRPGPSWWWLLSGLVVFTLADVVYAERVAHGTYALGTPLDALWSLGLTLLGTGALLHRGVGSSNPRVDGTGAIVVPTLASLVALAVLLVGRWSPVSPVATWLAALTLLAAVLRTQQAFRRLAQMYDLGMQARTDSLTGLGNRRMLHEHLHPLLTAPTPSPVAVLLLDLDHFKEINDTLGHHVGDELLRMIRPRLSPALRPGDLIVRLGGDEFAMVLPSRHGVEPESVARNLLQRLGRSFELDGVTLRIGASIGIAMFPEHASDTNGLLQRADVAMYAAKSAGGGVRRYDPASDSHSRERLRTIEELRQALETDELVLHFQPQCDVASGQVIGVEALVRWTHPQRGLLYPDTFLPLVEQTGLMPALTTTVLRQALEQCRRWLDLGLDVGVSVNLSASSLLDQVLPAQVSTLLEETGVPPHLLTLELTENTLMADPDQCRQTLVRLKELGVWLSVDDYGTGYSSLSYLRDLPVDELKLDRVFLRDGQGDRGAAIVRSTIDLAHALALRLVAEGVEDEASLGLLRRLGCDTAQGYHLSRPLPASAATAWLLAQAAAPPTVDEAV